MAGMQAGHRLPLVVVKPAQPGARAGRIRRLRGECRWATDVFAHRLVGLTAIRRGGVAPDRPAGRGEDL